MKHKVITFYKFSVTVNMIEGNRIKFGYGDVITSSSKLGWIKFTQVATRVEVGHALQSTEEMERLLPSEAITLTENKTYELYNLLKTVTKDNPEIEYKGYILDFTNYNEKSLEVVLRNAKNMVNLMVLAC